MSHTTRDHHQWGRSGKTERPHVDTEGGNARHKSHYQMDYGADAGDYVDAVSQNVNWDEVNRLAESLGQGGE